MQCRWSKVNRRKGGDLPDLLTAEDDLSENNCPDCGCYIEEKADLTRSLKENSDLKEAFIEADYKSVCQSVQLKDDISYAYRLLEDYKAEIKRLKDELSSQKSNQEKVLEEVGQPESNTSLRTPSSVKGEENGH